MAAPAEEGEVPASLLAAVAALAAEEAVVEAHPADAPAAAGEPEIAHGIVDVDLSELLDEPGAAAARARRARRDEDDRDAIEVYELDPMTLAEFETAVPRSMFATTNVEQEPEPTVSEIESYAPLPRAASLHWPALAIAGDAPRPRPGTAPQLSELKDWRDIIESLRRDAQAPFARTAASSSAGESRPDAAGKKRAKRTNGSPAQDEWGFFDPEQCGFEALLAKLDEISDKNDKKSRA
jgi:hypothetical protein